MPRPPVDPEQIKQNKKLRNERYRTDPITAMRNRERDRLYRERKREQARLAKHPDPLAQLADVTIQQQYLEEVEEERGRGVAEEGEAFTVTPTVTPVMAESMDEVNEVNEANEANIGGTILEDGVVLETFGDMPWDDGFGDGLNDDEFFGISDSSITDNGN